MIKKNFCRVACSKIALLVRIVPYFLIMLILYFGINWKTLCQTGIEKRNSKILLKYYLGVDFRNPKFMEIVSDAIISIKLKISLRVSGIKKFGF